MPLTDKIGILTNKMRKNSADNVISERNGVLRRRSVPEFGPPADGRHNVRPRREPIPKRSLAFNGKIEKLGTSDDVAESTGSYWFSGRNVRKIRPFECNDLAISRAVGARKKGGSPKMQGHPTICMKIKGKKNLIGSIRRCL